MVDVDNATIAFRKRLAIVVALGAIWRYGFVIVAKRNQELLLNDSLYYSWQAGGLLNGVYFKDIYGVREAAEHGPLISIVMAPFSWGSPWQIVFQQRLVTASLGVVTIALVGILARRISQRTGRDRSTSDRIGIVAAAIAAAYPNLWLNDGVVMSESLGALLVCSILLAMVRLSDMSSPPTIPSDENEPLPTRPHTDRSPVLVAVMLGALIGLGALARSELVAAAPLAGVVVLRWRQPWRTSARLIGAIAITTIFVIAPWVAYNQSRFDESVTLSTNDGTTLIGANCPETYSASALGGWSLFCVLDVQGPPGVDDSVRSKLQRNAAIDYALDNLDRLPLVAVARVARSLDLYQLSNLVHSDVGEEKAEWAVWSGMACWYVLAPLAAVGLARTRRRERDILLVPVVIVLITSIAFYGSHRLRLSLEPVVVVGAAAAIVTLLQSHRDGRRRHAPDSAELH